MPLPTATYAERVALLLDRLTQLVRELQYCDGLNPAQWEALRYVAQANRYSRTPTALAKFLGLTKGTISQTIIALESKGYLRRDPSPGDRRKVFLTMTDAGLGLMARDPIASLREAAEQLIGEGGAEDVGGALVKSLTRLLHDLQLRHDLKQFGVCRECTLLCVGERAGSSRAFNCGLTGDALAESETAHICVDFRPAAA
jgi:DNA-binding MarR family transcriptional regulator